MQTLKTYYHPDIETLKTHYHPDLETLENKSVFIRLATRGITLQGNNILLMYTARYEDYSLPGGGLDEGENKIDGMMRELTEETGAQEIKNIKPFGVYEEYRPWYKPDYDIQHMISYCYTCEINKELGTSSLESYETKNGMKAIWINIHEAIKHNKKTMATSDKKGMSIERETFLLKLIAESII
jgi:ADP-ribose pyrophosphatase YjhB (NUDIX family)